MSQKPVRLPEREAEKICSADINEQASRQTTRQQKMRRSKSVAWTRRRRSKRKKGTRGLPAEFEGRDGENVMLTRRRGSHGTVAPLVGALA